MTRRWNPKMEQFIFGERTAFTLSIWNKRFRCSSGDGSGARCRGGRRSLFPVCWYEAASGTIVTESASRCGQYCVNHRWLGGMLTTGKRFQIRLNASALSKSSWLKRYRADEAQVACRTRRANWTRRWAASRKWVVCPIFSLSLIRTKRISPFKGN